MPIDPKKLDSIGEAMWSRFNLGEPEKADVPQVLKAMFIQELMRMIEIGNKVIPPKEIIEILRTFADGLELAVTDDNRKTNT